MKSFNSQKINSLKVYKTVGATPFLSKVLNDKEMHEILRLCLKHVQLIVIDNSGSFKFKLSSDAKSIYDKFMKNQSAVVIQSIYRTRVAKDRVGKLREEHSRRCKR